MKAKDVVNPQGTDHKYHINSKGVYAECKAKVRPCPFGGAAAHFNNIDEAAKVADNLNNRLEKLSSDNSKFGIATYEKDGEVAIVRTDKDVKNSILQFVNTKSTLERLNKIKENYKAEVLKELQENGIKTIDVTGIAKVTAVGSYESSSFSEEKFSKLVGKENLDYFKKESDKMTRSFIKTSSTGDDNFETPKRITNVLGLTINKDNNTISLSEEGQQKLAQYIQLQDLIKKAEEKHTDLNKKLLADMGNLKLSKIAVDNDGKPKFYSSSEISKMVYDNKDKKGTSLTYYPPVRKKVLDKDRIEKEHPELYKNSFKTEQTKEYTRITPKKQKELKSKDFIDNDSADLADDGVFTPGSEEEQLKKNSLKK